MCSGVSFYGIRDNALRMAKEYLADDCIILDIGANFGGFSLRLGTHVTRSLYQNVQIHAFEPNPSIFRRYLDNLALNPSLTGLVTAHPFGLGSKPGNEFFNVEAVNSGAGRVKKRKYRGSHW